MVSDSVDTAEAPAPQAAVRRYDLDWLRVLAFWGLILYHVAIAFVPWPVYPYRNRYTAGEWMEWVLQWLHQWRLPLLFLISGMGTAFAFRRRSGGKFIGERSKRLLIPLLFGMLVINMPINLYGARAIVAPFKDLPAPYESFADFLQEYWLEGAWLEASYHLWFLGNLFIYSLVLTPVFAFLRKRPDAAPIRWARRVIEWPYGLGLLLLIPIPLIAVELLIKPWSPGTVGEGYEFFWYLGLFFIGYILIQVGDTFWDALAGIRYTALAIGVVASAVLFTLYAYADSVSVLYGVAVLNGGWTEYGFSFWGEITFPAAILHSVNTWAWCMTAFAWAARYLNRPSRRLAYFNQSVYPFYLVHMTILLVALWYVRLWDVWWPITFTALTVIVFAGCWATFEVVKRTRLTRLLFGIKPLPETTATSGTAPGSDR